MPYLEVADLSMYYEEHGRLGGQPLVLLHGGGGTIDDPVGGWALLLPAFLEVFRVFLVEHRGHGRTTNPAAFQSFDQMGEDIVGLIEGLDLSPVHIAGISDGGVLALDLALRRPDAVRSVTVIGTNFRVDELTLGAAAGLDPEDIEAAAPAAAAEFAARHDPANYPGYWKDLIAHIKDNNAINPSWSPDDLSRIDCPTLLIAGEDDSFANAEQMMVMKREIPGAEWLIVNHAGHAVHSEHPDFIGARIADFLRRHS